MHGCRESGVANVKQNANRERIREYVGAHEGATVREIMDACEISSTSVVAHHLKALQYDKADATHLREENARLKRRVAKLEARLAKILDLADVDGDREG